MTRSTGRIQIQTGRISLIMLLPSSQNWLSYLLLPSQNPSLKRRKICKKNKKLLSLSLLLILSLLNPGEVTTRTEDLEVEEVAPLIEGRLHLRPLQMSLLSQWRPHKLPLNHQIGVTMEILHHLKWWQREDLFLQGVPLKIDPPFHSMFTDASHTGWGAHVEPEGLLYHGVWSC